MVDLGGKKKPICRRDHIFSVSPFVLYVLRTKAAQAGGGEQAAEGMKSHETKGSVIMQSGSKFGEEGSTETVSCGRAAVSVGQEPFFATIRGEGMRWKFSCGHRGLFEAREYCCAVGLGWGQILPTITAMSCAGLSGAQKGPLVGCGAAVVAQGRVPLSSAALGSAAEGDVGAEPGAYGEPCRKAAPGAQQQQL